MDLQHFSTNSSPASLSQKASLGGAENMLMVTTRRNRGFARPVDAKISPIEDALSGDGFQKSKTSYEHLKTVVPVFTPSLKESIEQCLLAYERETGHLIPPAYRKRSINAQASQTTQPRWQTNKQERLRAALWIFDRLPAASSATEAVNQMACVLAMLETYAANRLYMIPYGFSLDPTPLRLTEPVQETVKGIPVLVSYGIRHVSLFSRQGAVQIQCLPEHMRGADYQQRSQIPGVVILHKTDAAGQSFW